MSEWKEYKLDDIVSKLGDGLHGTPKYEPIGEYYFINGSNLINGHISVNENTKRVTIEEFNKYKKELNDRTIFVSINGTVGNIATYDNEKVILGKSACYFNIKETFSKDFIKYVVSEGTFQHYISENATGTTIKNVPLKAIREFKFKAPSLSTQTAIASILSSLDDKIELNNKINKNLEDLAQALFKHWFVDFEFPISLNCDSYDSGDGHDLLKLNKSNQGNHINQKNHITDTYRSSGGEMVESELGEIPKGWSAERLGDHLYVKGRIGWKGLKTADYLTDGSGYVIINGSDFKNERINFKNCSRISKERYDESPEIQLKDHDILITKDGTIGKLAFVDKLDEPTSVASGIFVVRIISKLLSTYFCWSFFKSYYFQKLVKGRIEGTVVPHLYQRDFVEMYIPIPPKELRSIYEEQSRLIFENISSNLRENLMLEDLRDMILPKLISGELEVNEDNV